jgi:signal peptidase II
MPSARTKSIIFWPIVVAVVVADFATKAAAVRLLVPAHVPHEVFGSAARLTLAYNRGGAFGLPLGSRALHAFAALVVLGFLYRLYRQTPERFRARVAALALLCGGAIGNLVDRARSGRGVVDFIDLGVGGVRFWTFNVADMAVCIGAILLVWVLLAEQRDAKQGDRRAARRS